MKDLVTVVTSRLRAVDMLARVGGDEFVALVPHVDLDAGRAIAEELRTLVGQIPVHGAHGTAHLAVSIGAVAVDDCADVEQARTHADAALYAEKTARHAARAR